MAYQLIIHSEEDEPLYSRQITAQLAHISIDFLLRCEVEQFVQPRRLPGGEVGYTAADIRRLAMVRRLRYSLDLELPAVEVVLHLRRQVIDLQSYLEELETEMERRENEWLQEIRELRSRLSEEGNWG